MSSAVNDAISSCRKITIAYANADTLNKIYEDRSLVNIYDNIDIIHPDGIGVFLASKYLYKENGMKERFAGSDFYEILTAESIKKNRSFFFFGHTVKELEKIQSRFPDLKINGLHEGYNFSDETVIEKINKAGADILIIGLSCPIQEKWISANKEKLSCSVILAVGDGIKVFSGDKIRGPSFIRKIGFEWLVRMLAEPGKNFSRYFFGIPLFIIRTISNGKTII
ncbi:MAG TPA: WecB/TagA/CpsF family glycosyltransferase [Ignavibacteria bacterium]|nr:WecB/TagA/CpsF family glycosyltransferase [Ignavibacteria bacterium]HRJ98434.1 WecB/TagA/CpsF family glycosyltransferase [Ignavibacteria bacterium]